MSQNNEKTNSYRTSIGRLEEILENIDNPDTGIDELADQVREAAGHLKICRDILTKTELEINNALEELEESDSQEDDS